MLLSRGNGGLFSDNAGGLPFGGVFMAIASIEPIAAIDQPRQPPILRLSLFPSLFLTFSPEAHHF